MQRITDEINLLISDVGIHGQCQFMTGYKISMMQNLISHYRPVITKHMHWRIMDTGLNSFFPQKNHQTVPVYAVIKKYRKDMIISGKTIITKGNLDFVDFR
jgi:oligoribonuclease (3'-5' exoribonuclease)